MLVQERKRAQRSNKAMVVMMVDAEIISSLVTADKITDALGEAVTTCVRRTDICGLLNEGLLIGVILTEIEAAKIETAHQVMADKIRGKLAALLSEELAQRVAITFHALTAVGDGNGIFDMALNPDTIRQASARGVDRLTTAKLEAEHAVLAEVYQGTSKIKVNQAK